MQVIPTPRRLAQRGEFYYQLGQLTATGVGVTKAVELLANKPPSRSFKQPLQLLKRHLAEGDSFSDAIGRLGLWTPTFDIALIDAGERSGRMDAVFTLLANYYTDRATLVRRVMSDLAYPAFLFHFAIIVLPFVEFFKTGDLTSFLLQTLGVFVPVYAVAAGLIYGFQGRRSERFRSFLETILSPIPLVGAARKSLSLARLSIALEALLNAGVTIIEAWDLAAAASGSPAIQRAVATWRPQVVAGLTPSDAINSSRVFPETFANLYHTAEVSGKLDETLRRLYNFYLEEGTRKTQIICAWLPRVIYLAVALLVAFKVIGFYSGMAHDLDKILGGP